MNVQTISVTNEYRYCLEQSYLFDVVDMVTPRVFMRKDRDNSHSQS